MASKSAFFCSDCGYESAKWVGKCPSCNSWNTLIEEPKYKTKKVSTLGSSGSKPQAINEINLEALPKIKCHDGELDRVLGGGIVAGSMILLGGEPGIGKSTLMLQVALGQPNSKILYVSGEESPSQIGARAVRLNDGKELDGNVLILTETSTENIIDQANEIKPSFMIVDSIQTLYSAQVESGAGSISQVRQSAAELMKFAKETGIPVFLIGHITKDGSLAGPKILEHMVDTVIQFEGDRHLSYRILRTTKNRFGSNSELGIYEMQGRGLRQVSNPSEILLSQRDADLTGVAIGATIEGNRVLLVEIQSLVSTAAYGTPQRSSTGFDSKRLNMLLAVLEKRAGMRFGLQDVFLNMAGGLKIEDPAIDLAVCVALVSSLEEVSVSEKVCFAAEVGLGGELRAVNRVEQRIAEAAKLGFETIYVSGFAVKGLDISKMGIEIKAFKKLTDLFTDLFR